MKTFALVLGGIMLLACSHKITGDGTGQIIKVKNKKMMTAGLGKSATGLPFQILDAEIKGNTLVLAISYEGGCGFHDFQLIGSEAISKSLPPIRSVSLLHTLASTEEKCKATVNTTLKFDIKKLAYKQEKGSEIYLTLEGWKERLTYVYK